MQNISKRGSGAFPAPSSLGDTRVAPVQFDYVLEAYPTLDLTHGKGPSRGGSGTVSPLPILTEADRKTPRVR